MKIKKGDNVFIIGGKDKGSKGKVLSVFPTDQKIIVEGIAIRKRHIRPKRQGEKGQVVEQPGRIAISNVKILCSKCSKPTRVGYRMENAKKVRICKQCEGII